MIHAFQWRQYLQVYTFYATQLLYLHTKETSNDSTPLLTLPAQQSKDPDPAFESFLDSLLRLMALSTQQKIP